MAEPLGTHSYITEKHYLAPAGAANGETLKTLNNYEGYGIIYYDPVASRTGVILEAGVENGQHVTVVNKATGAFSITFATAATSNVAGGANVVIGQNQSCDFKWSVALGRWVPVGISLSASVTYLNTNIVQAVTATDTGATTGVINDTTTHATVTSSASTKIVTLPAPVVGRQLIVDVGANGVKVQTTAPATVGINGGTGASAVSAIAANSTCRFICVSATSWKGDFLDADSDVAKIPAAA